MASTFTPLVILLLLGWLSWKAQAAISNLYFSKLSKFPGPKLAGATSFWRAFIECFLGESFCHKLEGIHAKYGEVVRIGPNELHFSNPKAYLEIYNNANRWDKDYALYKSFNEDRTSFGFLTYKEAKERKDALNKLFSQKALVQAQDLIVDKVNALCGVFEALAKENKPADLNWGFRCLTMDVITYLCFGKSVDAIHEPNFKAPIIVAMDASSPIFVRFKHFEWYKNMIMGCPPKISKIVSPATSGLVELQQILGKQIKELSEHPEELANLPHNMTIYHQLMDKEAYRSGTVPSAGSLYEESQVMMFAGADTTGSTLMVAVHYLLQDPAALKRLQQEILGVWPKLATPAQLKDLERLPYLNAVLKEALRMFGGVVSGLLRVVPEGGAKICDTFVPGGTVVSCGSTFVHNNPDVFPEPFRFRPDRWLEDPGLDQWLVAFSKGPRSCLGINLAWQELRTTLSHVIRRFDMQLDPSSAKTLEFHDSFLPFYTSGHLKVKMVPAKS